MSGRSAALAAPGGVGKLLLVDDDPSAIEALRQALAEVTDLRFATRARDALRLALEDPPDVILLDAEMPECSGFALCVELKGHPSLADSAIIFVTSHREAHVEAAVFDLGAADFISKPINPAVVRARVATQLRLLQATRALRRLANEDGLTGLANRRVLDERLAVECERSQRGGTPLALVMIDIDHFKRYNDHHGHQAGDECLRVVADLLDGSFRRPADLVARYGGEEFAVLLPDTEPEGAMNLVHRWLAALSARALPHGASPSGPFVSTSVGLACIPATSPGWRVAAPDTLIAAADRALYEAKATGRARAYWTVVAGGDDAGPTTGACSAPPEA